jgi:carbamoyltransferase
MYILGIHAGHDASASLLKDGELMFASEEERYSKLKHHNGFPANAIANALTYAGISTDEVDYFAFSPPLKLNLKSFRYLASESLNLFKNLALTYGAAEAIKFLVGRKKYHKSLVSENVNKNFTHNTKKIFFTEHHTAHIASSYLCSGFKESINISWDFHGIAHSSYFGYSENGDIHTKYKIEFPHSLGFLYAYITQFLGFTPWNDEGKVMGLSSYGKNEYDFSRLISLDGYVHKINPSYLHFPYFQHNLFVETQNYNYPSELLRFLGAHFKKFEFSDRSANIAHSLQSKIEEICLKIVKGLCDEFDSKNVCIAGGLGLNSKLNGEILASGMIENIFIQPAASDAGLSLGAALELYRRLGYKKRFVLRHAYYGDEFSADEIEDAIKNSGFVYERQKDISGTVAELLAKGKIVGWFQGRMELGPRALGNRSILADPRDEKNKDRLNKLKGREYWRPLAPSFLIEDIEGYVEGAYPSPFMTLVFRVKEEQVDEIPAIVHVDNTCRLQTVEKEINPKYWGLINEFKKETGIPCLLNTSMNVAGMPICCTPEDALFTLEKMGHDYLAIGDFLVQLIKT